MQTHIETIARQAASLIAGTIECPECGTEWPHDDNGRVGEDQCFCCRACGTHFEARAAVDQMRADLVLEKIDRERAIAISNDPRGRPVTRSRRGSR